MKKVFQKLRYKYKLLISMIAVFFIPCFLISIVFLSKIQEVEKKNEIEVSKQLFQQSSYNIDMIFEEIQRISYQFLSDKNLKSGSNPMKVTEKMNVCSVVDNYILNSHYIAELALYSGQEDIFFYSGGTVKPEMYYRQINEYSGFGAQEFYELVPKLSQHWAMVDTVKNMWTDPQSMLTVFVPLAGCPFQMAVFHVNMENVTDITDEFIDDGDILRLYYNGDMIYRSDETESLRVSDQQEGLPALEATEDCFGNLRTSMEGNQLTLLYTSQNSMAQVLLQRDLSKNRMFIRNISYLYICALLIFLLLGCAGVVLVWRGNYKPIGEILHYFPETETRRENEFDIVKNTLLSIQSEREKMSQNLNDSIPAYKKHILTSLIKGEFTSMEEFNTRASEAGIRYQNKNLFIVAVSIVDADQPNQIRKTVILEEILRRSEEQMPERVVCHGFVDMMNEKIIYVAGTELENQEEMGKALEKFQRYLQETTGFDLNIGCSNVYQKLEDMPKAYMEALSALDYRIVYGYGKIIYFSQISLNNYSHNWYPEELTRQFRIALKTKNEEQVHAVLDEIMEYLHHNNTPVYVAKYVCYDLMQILADSLVVAKSLPYKKTIGYHNIMNIARVSTFEQITEILHQNVSHVLSIDVKKEEENINHELKKRLEQFIEDNYSDCSFSMNSLVEEFGVSESTMRKNFKAVMQMTFIEYLAEKRIAKSKELLSGTELSLNQIALKVGYTDTSSFIRRFRQKTGMPPGEYRILNKK